MVITGNIANKLQAVLKLISFGQSSIPKKLRVTNRIKEIF